jgi:hypothetical protein
MNIGGSFLFCRPIKIEMKRNKVCVATISWARNDEEEKILRVSLTQLASLSIPVYITDGGSSESFKKFLRNELHFHVFEAKGLWSQAKKSITEAKKAGSKFIFYTEPDKQAFFSTHASSVLNEYLEDNTGVVIASRSPNGFSTFPSFQQMTETTINHCCAEIIGKEIDYCYGPFLFNAQLVEHLERLDADCGWGWRPFLFTIAHRLGFTIKVHENDFNCPPDQREDDAKERIYRMKQLTQNIDGLIKAVSIEL